jgi:hypothetical protein
MRAYFLSLGLLAMTAYCLATTVEPWFQGWEGNRNQSGNLLQVALGDGRKLFAKHVFTKADAYFHNGYYPTIYDNNEGYEKAHIVEDMHKAGAEAEQEKNFLGKPLDWIDRFGRNFYPSRHTHLGDSDCGDKDCKHEGHDHGHHEEKSEAKASGEREILPWLRLSTELDPERTETYVVSAYWLRHSMKKVAEAQQFLREGLRANPGDSELLYELGCIHNEERKDPVLARNLWELALNNLPTWQQRRGETNLLMHAQLLGHLASLEEKQTNYARAISHLSALKEFSPNRDSIAKWIDDVKAKQGQK